MKVIARGCAATMTAWPIFPLPSNINSSSPNSGPFCGKWSPEFPPCWRHMPRGVILIRNKTQTTNGGRTMAVTPAETRATFRKLHETGCFVLPNPWDIGSARALAHLGFKAVASTSAGFAWSIGKADNRVTLDEVLKHLTELSAAVDLPVNADFEGGFADEPDKVGSNVARAARTGVAGLSIEDSTGNAAAPLYEFKLAVERIKAARAAIDADKSGVLLTGRCEGFLVGVDDLAEVIERLQAYAEAGADCLYAPGIKTREQIAAVVKAV